MQLGKPEAVIASLSDPIVAAAADVVEGNDVEFGAPLYRRPPTGGDRPWWSAPRGDKVWGDKAAAFKDKGGLETRNVIGWKDTGLGGGVGW